MTIMDSENYDITTDLSSGRGSAAGIASLLDGLLSLRAILLRTLIATVEADRPELAPDFSEAYRTLAELQAEKPDVVATVLCYPQTGTWLSHMFGRLDAESDDDATSLASDSGYLGWLVAAALIACRSEGSTRLKMRDGEIMLPGRGALRIGSPGDFGPCELRWNDSGALQVSWAEGLVHIDSTTSESNPHWLPLRRVHSHSEGPAVWLDDLDPFRDLIDEQPNPPRLNSAQALQWQRDFAAAWELLVRELPDYVGPMRGCLQSLAPLSAQPLLASTSHTAHDGVGCVYTTAPADPCQLALTLIHEIQHTKFDLLKDHVELFASDTDCQFYAPWRDDPRPIVGLLHGIYAFFGVTDFWRTHRHSSCHGSPQAHADFELSRRQLSLAISQTMDSGLLTATGQRFLAGLAAAMHPWSTDGVPATARRAADEASIAHRTFWRVRNLVPDPDAVAELAARWWTDQPASISPTITQIEQRLIPEHHRRLSLAAQLTTLDHGAAALSVPGQPAGDQAYLAGYLSKAVALYCRELRADPLRPQAWAGLALALPKIFGADDFEALFKRGEVVSRVYQAVGPEVDILSLVRWFARTDG